MLPDDVASRRNDDRGLQKLSQNLLLSSGEVITTRQLLDQRADQDGLLAIGGAVIIPGLRTRSVATP